MFGKIIKDHPFETQAPFYFIYIFNCHSPTTFRYGYIGFRLMSLPWHLCNFRIHLKTSVNNPTTSTITTSNYTHLPTSNTSPTHPHPHQYPSHLHTQPHQQTHHPNNQQHSPVSTPNAPPSQLCLPCGNTKP